MTFFQPLSLLLKRTLKACSKWQEQLPLSQLINRDYLLKRQKRWQRSRKKFLKNIFDLSVISFGIVRGKQCERDLFLFGLTGFKSFELVLKIFSDKTRDLFCRAVNKIFSKTSFQDFHKGKHLQYNSKAVMRKMCCQIRFKSIQTGNISLWWH